MTFSKEEACFWNLDPVSENSGLKGTIDAIHAEQLKANPRRLILMVKDRDGLARIFKKQPNPLNSAFVKSSETKTTSTLSLDGTTNNLKQPTTTPRFNTTVLSSNRDLTKGTASGLALETTPNGTGFLTITNLPIRETTRFENSIPAIPLSPKRKPSQSDIRPTPKKVHCALADSGTKTPLDGIANFTINNIHYYHTQAKCSHHVPTNRLQGPVAYRTATKSTVVEAQGELPDFPRSPSCSPISENEGIEELQALLRGPAGRRLRFKGPAPAILLETDTEMTVEDSQENSAQTSTCIAENFRANKHQLTRNIPQPQASAQAPTKITLKLKIPASGSTTPQDSPTGFLSTDLSATSDAEQLDALVKKSKISKPPSLLSHMEGESKFPVEPTKPKKTKKEGAEQPNWNARKEDTKDSESTTTARNKDKDKGTPVKRGPRGPYKKTRERMEMEQQSGRKNRSLPTEGREG